MAPVNAAAVAVRVKDYAMKKLIDHAPGFRWRRLQTWVCAGCSEAPSDIDQGGDRDQCRDDHHRPNWYVQ
jgi:hypothetical protein